MVGQRVFTNSFDPNIFYNLDGNFYNWILLFSQIFSCNYTLY